MAGEISDGAILTDRIPADIEESVNHIILGLGYSSRNRKDIEIVNSVVVSIDDDVNEQDVQSNLPAPTWFPG